MNILVAYYSLTGNTKKVAEAIYEALPEPKELKKLKDIDSIEDYDLIFVGFPVHSHSVPYPVETFLRRLPAGLPVALFMTHGSIPGTRLSREALEQDLILAGKTRILGTFTSRGHVSAQAMDVFSRSPEHELCGEMAVTARHHPDQNDLDDAQVFARWILSLANQSS
jgi:flavodoxin